MNYLKINSTGLIVTLVTFFWFLLSIIWNLPFEIVCYKLVSSFQFVISVGSKLLLVKEKLHSKCECYQTHYHERIYKENLAKSPSLLNCEVHQLNGDSLFVSMINCVLQLSQNLIFNCPKMLYEYRSGVFRIT